MKRTSGLEYEIRRIGEALVNCSNNCAGAVNDKSNGILPRCLVLEVDNRKKNRGSIVVGINPGHAKEWEKREYKSNPSYGTLLKCWNERIRELPYYKRLRHFVDEMGFSGPILWTDLAKCETAKGYSMLPLQTMRICVKKYLYKELELMPTDLPLVAVGFEAYKALSYHFPSRIVIGIPHPSSRGQEFKGLFISENQQNHLIAEFKFELCNWRDSKMGKAGWLDVSKKQIR